jgi:hypothetical protein
MDVEDAEGYELIERAAAPPHDETAGLVVAP